MEVDAKSRAVLALGRGRELFEAALIVLSAGHSVSVGSSYDAGWVTDIRIACVENSCEKSRHLCDPV